MAQDRFVMIDRFASKDPWPYHIMDRKTGERDYPCDIRSLCLQVVAERNEADRNGEIDY